VTDGYSPDRKGEGVSRDIYIPFSIAQKFCMEKKKLDFSGKTLAKLGIFTALSYVLTFFEFPIFPATPFLKLDFSNLFVLIGGFSLGTVHGVIILVVKETLCLIKSSTVVGQLANVIIGLCYALIPLLLYGGKKTFKRALIGLIIGSITMSLASLPVNRYINFPLYGAPDSAFLSLWGYVFAFNLIKAISLSILTIILYKKVKGLLNF
jgi:riboflavin transporter FmnP